MIFDIFTLISIFFPTVLSVELQNTIKWMMHPDPASRPDVNSLLNTHRIRKILESRRMIHRKVVSAKQ